MSACKDVPAEPIANEPIGHGACKNEVGEYMAETSHAQSQRLRQFGALGGANVLSLIVNLLTITLMTHLVSPNTLGAYRYAIAFMTAAAVICQFGIPYAASLRLTRLHAMESRRTIVAVSVLMLLISGAIGVFAMGVLALLRAQGADWAEPLIWAAPAIFTLTLQVAYINLLNGANAIGSLAIQVAAPPALILAGVVGVHQLIGGELSYPLLLTIYTCAYLVVHLATVSHFRSNIWGSLRQELRLILPITRTAGRRVYVGTLFAAATTSGLNVALGALLGMEKFSLFAIAYSMAVPVQMIPSTLGIVLFKQSATSDRLGRRTIRGTVFFTAFGLVAYIACILLLFPAIFPPQFQGARPYAVALAVGSACLGLGDFFNRFIGARGRADYLMYGAIIAGVVNIAATVALALRFGLSGAIWGMVMASTSYLLSMTIFYRRTVRAGFSHSPPGHPTK